MIQLLRQRDVCYELIVNPDVAHETMLYKRWMYTFGRVQDFLKRFVWEKKAM